MFTQVFERKGADLVPLKDGPTVILAGEDHNYVCTFAEPGGEPKTLPSSEFHALHREATPDEVETAGKKTKPAPK